MDGSLAKNSFWQLVTTFAYAGSEFVILLMLASRLTPNRFGIFIVSLSAAKIIFLVCEIRIHELLIPKLARYLGRSRRGVWSWIRWSRNAEGSMNILAFLLCLGASRLIGSFPRFRGEPTFLIVCAGYVLGNTFMKYSSLSVFRCISEMNWAGYMASATGLLKLSIMLIPGIRVEIRLAAMALVSFGLALIQAHLANWRLRLHTSPPIQLHRLGLSLRHRQQQLKLMASNYTNGALDILHREMDVQLLAFFGGPIVAGSYRLAKSLAYVMLEALSPLILVLLPEIASRLARDTVDRLNAFLRKITLILGGIGLGGGVALGCGVAVYFTYFARAQMAAFTPFIFLVSVFIFLAPWMWTQAFLVAVGAPQSYSRASAIGAGSAIIVALILIPRYEVLGAAIAHATGLSATVVLSLLAVRRHYPLRLNLFGSSGIQR